MSIFFSIVQDGDKVDLKVFFCSVVVDIRRDTTQGAEYHVFEHLPSVFEDAGAERCDHGVGNRIAERFHFFVYLADREQVRYANLQNL